MKEEEFLELKKRLKKFNFSDEELNNGIRIYDYLIDVFYDGNYPKILNRYCFLHRRKFWYTDYENNLYNLFINSALIYIRDIENFIDYSFLHGLMERFMCNDLDDFNKLIRVLVVNGDCKDKKQYILNITDPFYDLLETIIDRANFFIDDSKLISDDYKEVFNTFFVMRQIYYEDFRKKDKEKVFTTFINMLYYYAIINNLLKNDLLKYVAYLKKIVDDIPLIIDRLTFHRQITIDETLTFIDEDYHNKGHVKVIK